MFSKYLSSLIAIILFSFNVSPSKLLQAQSVAVGDNYQISEDSELKTGTGPILEVSFDEEIAPGFIDTDMTSGLDDRIKDAAISNVPLKRFGKVEDIAEMASFLSSEKSSYITGQVFTVDGGMVM